MQLEIKSKDIELTPQIRSCAEEKIGGLEKFIKGLDQSGVLARVELSRTTKHHQTGKVFRAEVQMHLPGKDIRSEAVAKTILMAINEVKDELQRELKEYKDKQAAKQKQAVRKLKTRF